MYYAELKPADYARNDSDRIYFRDAATHLDSYELIQSDFDALKKSASGNELESSATSLDLGAFWKLLASVVANHNKKVEEFSVWESKSFETMVRTASVDVSYSPMQGVEASLETMDGRNLVRHMDDQSLRRKRSLDVVKLKIEPVGWFLQSSIEGAQAKGEDLKVAWSEKYENVAKLKQLVEGFMPERTERIESLKESAGQIELGYQILIRNLQIAIKEMEDGTFRGRCETEGEPVSK